MKPFDYYAATSIQEAWSLLNQTGKNIRSPGGWNRSAGATAPRS